MGGFMEHIQALLFDLDNTLLDRTKSFAGYAAGWIDRHFPDLPPEEKRSLVQVVIEVDEDGYKDRRQMFTELLDRLPWRHRPSLEELMEVYDREYVQSAVPKQDAVRILNHCRERYKLGLITNGRTHIQHAKLDRLQIRPLFDVILVSQEAGVNKPDRQIFDMALAALHLRAEQCIYIGDHPVNDIAGAAGAGMQAIWIRGNQPWADELSVQPLAVISELSELLEIV
jgi:putative hydrolase of the HAD superfamily